MIKYFRSLISLFILCMLTANAASGQNIRNPSFEGRPGKIRTPQDWGECNTFSSPDTQPGIWDVRTAPSHGQSYVGIATRGNLGPYANHHEDVQTQLLKPLLKGGSYPVSMDLATAANWGHETPDDRYLRYINPCRLKIYGGTKNCQPEELLWESPVIDHNDWKTYDIELNPKNIDVQYLKLEAHPADGVPAFGNIIIDNIRECYIPLKNLSDTVICQFEPMTLDLTLPGLTYLWQDGSTDPVYTISADGNYSVQVSNSCISKTFSFEVTSRNCVCDTAIPLQSVAYDSTICETDDILLDVATPGGIYLWDDGHTGGIKKVNSSGQYTVEVTNGCDTESFEFNISTRDCSCDDAVPFAFAPLDTGICNFESVLADVFVPNGEYQWNDNDDRPIRFLEKPGNYTVTVSDNCFTQEVEFNIYELDCRCEISFPNVFSPNGDGMNDTFVFSGTDVTDGFNLQIVDRSGKLVFETDDLRESWDGANVPAGVYYWSASVNCEKSTDDNDERTYRGTVTIVR